MPYSSPYVLLLEAVRDWVAGLSTWQTWVGSVDTAVLKGRITWPKLAVDSNQSLPVMILSLGPSRITNLTGSTGGGANFWPSGALRGWVYAPDESTVDIETSYSTFLDKFSGLIQDMADNAHAGEIYVNEIAMGEPPVVHSTWVNQQDSVAEEGLAQWWQGEFRIEFGAVA